MKKLIFCLMLSFFTLVTKAQSPQQIEKPNLFGKDQYYYQILPPSGEIKGVLVLVPGFGEHPLSVTAQSSIVQEAEKNNIAVIIANLSKNNLEFAIDNAAIDRLGKMITHFYTSQKLSKTTKLFIGGFSIGGTSVLKFYAIKNKEFKISKVFAIDPPLDMVRLRKSMLRGREKELVPKLDALNKTKTPLAQWLKELSVYNPDYTTFTMLPDYTNTSLRIYSEPDIVWWIKNRNMDLYDMNVTDDAGYINKLLQKSPDQKAELILTQNKGIRNGTQKHPHSWSIAEPTDLIQWLLQ